MKIYGNPVVPTRLAQDVEAAVLAPQDIGYPVVLKVHSETVTHKTDVGGVQLNLRTEEEVRWAYRAIAGSVATKAGSGAFLGVTVQPMILLKGYELILGSSVDPLFGPVLLFGSGGQLVEVYRDRALALPPLTATLAQRLMEATKILSVLKGVRGREAVNLRGLQTLLMHLANSLRISRGFAKSTSILSLHHPTNCWRWMPASYSSVRSSPTRTCPVRRFDPDPDKDLFPHRTCTAFDEPRVPG